MLKFKKSVKILNNRGKLSLNCLDVKKKEKIEHVLLGHSVMFCTFFIINKHLQNKLQQANFNKMLHSITFK